MPLPPPLNFILQIQWFASASRFVVLHIECLKKAVGYGCMSKSTSPCRMDNLMNTDNTRSSENRDHHNSAASYGTIIASACFMIQAVGIGTQVTYGVFFNSILTEFQWSRAFIAGASSFAFFLMGLFGVLVGRLNDRYGPKLLMRISALFLGTGLMLMAHVSSPWQLYLYYGVLYGIGLSAIDVLALTTTARWFTRRRGMMTGIVKVGTGAGQFTIPLAASLLIVAYGWRQAYLVIGAAAMILLLFSAHWLKPAPDHLAARARTASAPSPDSQHGLKAGQAIRTPQLWTLCILNFFLIFSLSVIIVHIVPHARDIGLSPTRAAGVLSAIGAVSMVGRFITGMAIDRIGSKAIMVICFFVLIAGLIWLQTASSLWMLYLFACVYGLAHGGFFTSISPITAEVFGIAAHGTIFGIIVCFGTTGGAIGPILAGQLFDSLGNYSTAFWIITAFGVIGLGLILSLKPVKNFQ
jgi:MFS family permease